MKDKDVREAQWRSRGKKDRSKIFGSWSCWKCGQRLAAAFTNHIEQNIPGGGGYIGPALVFPLNVDYDNTFPQSANGKLYRKTQRSAGRLTSARTEVSVHAGIIEDAINNNQEVDEIWQANLLRFRRNRIPETEEIISINQRDVYPIRVKCYNHACNAISQISNVVPFNLNREFELKAVADMKGTERGWSTDEERNEQP